MDEVGQVRHRRHLLKTKLPLLHAPTEEKNGGQVSEYSNDSRSAYVSYVNRVPLARRKKPDNWITVVVEVFVVMGVIFTVMMAFMYADRLHLLITRFYARMGVTEAQHLLGQHLLQSGKQNRADITEAIYWMRKAADNGDPISSYNLVVTHMKEYVKQTDLTMDDVSRLMKHASQHGIGEANRFIDECQTEGKCAWLTKPLEKHR